MRPVRTTALKYLSVSSATPFAILVFYSSQSIQVFRGLEATLFTTDFPAYSDAAYSDTPLSVTLLTIPKPFVSKNCHSKQVKTRLE